MSHKIWTNQLTWLYLIEIIYLNIKRPAIVSNCKIVHEQIFQWKKKTWIIQVCTKCLNHRQHFGAPISPQKWNTAQFYVVCLWSQLTCAKSHIPQPTEIVAIMMSSTSGQAVPSSNLCRWHKTLLHLTNPRRHWSGASAKGPQSCVCCHVISVGKTRHT